MIRTSLTKSRTWSSAKELNSRPLFIQKIRATAQGEWSIGSITPKSEAKYTEKKFLKDFVVIGEKGEVVELEGYELKEPEIKFHWWDEGKNVKVKYKAAVDGKEVTGESTFVVRKPVITMSAETPQGNPYCGSIEGGPDNVLYETPG